MTTRPIRALFVCTHNAARSQMAEALLRWLGGDRFEVALADTHPTHWQVAVIWGIGVALAIHVSASLSGAHLNPAISLTLALLRPSTFPRARLLPYIAAQLGGAVLAGLTVAGLSSGPS